MFQVLLFISATTRTPLMTKIINEHIFKEGTWSRSFFDEYWILFEIPFLGELLIYIIGLIQYIIE